MPNPSLTQLSFDTISEIEKAQSQEQVQDILSNKLADFGIEYFMLSDLFGFVEKDGVNIGTYPAEWLERFVSKRYTHKDPLIQSVVMFEEAPSVAKLRAGQQRGTKGWSILHEASEFGLSEGWAFALTGPNGHLSGLSFMGKNIETSPAERAAIRLLGIFAHSKLMSFRRQTRFPEKRLTLRELDVLRWVAEGLNDEEISEKLGISPSTVHMHVENAKLKLGASKRVKAVAEALRTFQLRL